MAEQAKQKCDCCGAQNDTVAKYPKGTLWGRAMRLCKSCRTRFDHEEEMQSGAIAARKEQRRRAHNQ